jgi:hypothetical protein
MSGSKSNCFFAGGEGLCGTVATFSDIGSRVAIRIEIRPTPADKAV